MSKSVPGVRGAQYSEPGLDFAGPSSAAIAALVEDYPGKQISDSQLDLGWSFNSSGSG